MIQLFNTAKLAKTLNTFIHKKETFALTVPGGFV